MRIEAQNPTTEPLTFDDLVKINCRVDTDEEAVNFDKWIVAAREYCESKISQFFITRQIDIYLDRWPTVRSYWPYLHYLTGATHYTHFSEDDRHDVIQIPYGPLQSITGITYVDPANIEQTWDTAEYYVSTGKRPRIQALNGFPDHLRRIDCIKITGNFGYGATADDVPASAIHAMLLYVGEAYKQRSQSSDLTLKVVPIAIDNLLATVSAGGEYFIG